jgi:hypothetical protein
MMTMPSSSFVPIRSSEVREHNGRPTLFVNGSPHCGLTYMSYIPKEENYTKFAELGVEIISFTVTSDCHAYSEYSAPVAVAPGEYDYSDFDARIERVLKAFPNAYLLPRVYTMAPEWWCQQNEDELVRFGQPRAHPRPGIDGFVDRNRLAPSMASIPWRKWAGQNLRLMIEHIYEKGWGDHILGYHFASGIAEEWVQWGSHNGYFGDYSPAMLKAFREFLTEKYQNDNLLQKAWNRKDITLETVEIPTIQERVLDTGQGQIQDPQTSQNVIDYLICHSYVIVDSISSLAKAIKDALPQPRITLAFSGSYFASQSWLQHLSQNSGSLALDRLLDCSYIDALSSPSEYMYRSAGTGYGKFMTAEQSVAMRGKLWFDENDIRTHLNTESGFGTTHTVSDTICVQRRQFSAVLQQGCAMWWFDMAGNWYDEPMHQEVQQTVHVSRRAFEFDRSSISEIALVVDPESIAYMRGATSMLYSLLNAPGLSFGHCGTPYDTILLNDLDKAKDYKLYAFLNIYHMDTMQRQMVDRVVKCDDKTAWWFYASGYVGDTIDIENLRQTTGFNISTIDGHNRPETELRPGDHPILTGLDKSRFYGKDSWFMCPFFFVDDDRAESLGLWLQDEHITLMAAKEMDGWKSVWSAAPNPPAWLIRQVARWAGVHVYNDIDEALYANKSFLTVSSSNDAGPRTIKLPRRTSVYELYDKHRQWQDVTKFTFDMPRRHTSVFFLGSKQQWRVKIEK